MLPRKRRNSTTGGNKQCDTECVSIGGNKQCDTECVSIGGNKQCDTTTPVRHSSLSPDGFPLDGWSVYLIYSKSRKRTYVGSTTDVFRRLRQHRGEIRGGARSTSIASDWELISYVTGFRGRSPACRWEKIIKGRCRGLGNRVLGMVFVGYLKMCPEGSKKSREYEVPVGLHYIDVGSAGYYELT